MKKRSMMMTFGVSTTHFTLEIDGTDCSEVREIHGFSIYGSNSSKGREQHGKTFRTELSLTRRFSDTAFFDWLQEMEKDEKAKRKGKLSFVTPDGEIIVSFSLTGVFPIEWKGPALIKGNSWGGSESALEQVVLAVEAITRE